MQRFICINCYFLGKQLVCCKSATRPENLRQRSDQEVTEATMGIQDFVTIFDQLDSSRKGFITVDQLLALQETVFYSPVAYDHVESALLLVCGPSHGGKVPRDSFLPLLEEISRRQSLEEQAYWDFQALDYGGRYLEEFETGEFETIVCFIVGLRSVGYRVCTSDLIYFTSYFISIFLSI
jgi:hypothetical protein